ncbi:phosphotransferase family protein [Dactylonectria macrodidyma]|uniref:Phosphotransferase family protein n=1 Tax=Dactylonectria macrodidyma TaxID=307937 RepID=A0A9P9F462_9HYPO|nr:phosphotransferase family protein [Dactylonectria macrodidyma]
MVHPSSAVLTAFGISSSAKTLPGGTGLCFVADGIVLKPSDDEEESQWVAHLTTKMLQYITGNEYRLTRPIPVARNPDLFVYDGWTADSLLLSDAREPTRFQHIARLNVSKPLFLTTRRNRFHEADLVTWGEKDLDDVGDVNIEVLSIFKDALDHLKRLERPLPTDLACQLIHGDLTGNVLSDSQSEDPPGIIDMTFYWRPPAYAEAIIVADGLVWHGQGRGRVEMLGVHKFQLQLLVRALFWRCVTFAIDPDMAFVRLHVPRVDFRGAARIVGKLINEAKEANVNV